jgi:glyoxylase-like metal-dependent hydrolase (beta-lactamase superfamily II)
MLQYIRGISSLPVKYAINTNSQPHRYFGNSVFKRAGAQIIAHPAEVARMSRLGDGFADSIERILALPQGSVRPPVLPQRLVTDATSLELGGVTLNIRHHGASHTPASLVVSVVQDNVVCAGDILYAGRLLAVLPDSNVRQWLATYESLKAYGDALFIPGHGRPARLESFDSPTYFYLKLLHMHMVRSLEANLEAQDAIGSLDQSAYSDLVLYQELAGRNASRAYLQAERAFFE